MFVILKDAIVTKEPKGTSKTLLLQRKIFRFAESDLTHRL